DVELAQKALATAQEVIRSGEFNMVILDEINVAVDYGLIPEQDLLDLIQGKPPLVHLVLTGRYAADSVRELADMVSEVTEVKHHYYAGVKGQAGIEY
ncbi:MAG: cob(I)yrinic acid a,c-diamide adenosyltransferase, partial [Deltaproteobacteria bacterium]